MTSRSENSSIADPGWRHELKMVCEERARGEVIAEIRRHEMGFGRLYPEREVQSIYLDTHEGRAVQDNLAGISDRKKLRLRWYGAQTGLVHSQLELKQRRNLYGCKETVVLPDAVQIDGVNRLAFMRGLRGSLPNKWRRRLELGLEPAQWIRYRRQYFGSFDGSVRITVDRHLRACDLRDRWRIGWRRQTLVGRILVVECKAAMAKESELRELVGDLRLRVDRCSKFVMASAPNHGPLASWCGW